MTATMRAVVLDEPGPVDHLQVRDVPIPEPRPGWVVIRVEAFGLNHSEQYTRLGYSGAAVTFPRILGIEATGGEAAVAAGASRAGPHVATMMGDMARSYDGGYAQFTC